MTHRDKFRDHAYFDRHIRRIASSIEKFGALIATHDIEPEHRRRLRHTVFRREVELLVARYSRGDPPDKLREALPSVIRAFAAYQQQAGRAAHDFSHFDAYVYALWIASLAILLEVPDAELRVAVDLLDNEGRDALFDRLVALRVAGRAAASTLMYPQPYRPLFEALDASGEARTKLILEFLNGYYAGISGAYWHNSHLGEDTGYFGYWCFELAAFVKALKISRRRIRRQPLLSARPRSLGGSEVT